MTFQFFFFSWKATSGYIQIFKNMNRTLHKQRTEIKIYKHNKNNEISQKHFWTKITPRSMLNEV